MPRPPVTPTIDWQDLLSKGKTFQQWLDAAEDKKQAEKIKADMAHLILEPHTESFLKGVAKKVHVVAFAEDWCGDVVRHVPMLARFDAICPCLTVKYFTRGDAPEVFVRFLTNGGEAIPKFVFLSSAFVETGNWGPMSFSCRERISRGKARGDVGSARKEVSLAYEADTDRIEVVRELLYCIDIAASSK